jgi:hypothetical protein
LTMFAASCGDQVLLLSCSAAELLCGFDALFCANAGVDARIRTAQRPAKIRYPFTSALHAEIYVPALSDAEVWGNVYCESEMGRLDR